MSILKARRYRFPLHSIIGVSRLSHPACKSFTLPQREHAKNPKGENAEGRVMAKALRRSLRRELGRKPTRMEYRAAKREYKTARSRA